MTDVPDAAVQIAAEALRATWGFRSSDAVAEVVVPALAHAGWLHDPAEVAALRAVADAATTLLCKMGPTEDAADADAVLALMRSLLDLDAVSGPDSPS